MLRNPPADLRGRRVLITGAARGIGAELARRLHSRGARPALLGIEPELLAEVAGPLRAPWAEADVADAEQVSRAVEQLVTDLGGLDAFVANAGIAAQMPMIGSRPGVLEQHLRVNVLGVHHTIEAAGPHIAHPGGYALLISSLASAVNIPLLGAYSASKAAVEAMGNTLRLELAPSGARVGVAYFAELDTDMTRRGFGTRAGEVITGGRTIGGVAPLSVGIDALERGVARRSRRVVAPAWVRPLVPLRDLTQRVVEVAMPRRFPNLAAGLEIAKGEDVTFTTVQPGGRP